ncbi:hypothetical protein [Pseudophaeobacter sp. EL27]|uniref:hypothetical protein n=1 Tax=Pseudophaeobacter sp. EL27 TaxID=2107580 RepID=UPI000EFB7D98|nr:hypothetical protein [Pseudophaeobacter sp. EL27]
MTKTVFDLFKALLNATLLLLALCLFLGWQFFTSARDVTDRLGEIGTRFAPIHNQLQSMTEELSALNQALTDTAAPDSAEMRFRLTRLEEQLSGLKEETHALSQLPAQVVGTAVEAAVQEISAEITTRLPHLEPCAPGISAPLN